MAVEATDDAPLIEFRIATRTASEIDREHLLPPLGATSQGDRAHHLPVANQMDGH
ncbi:hypothetical protein [Kribbella sp. C-35]|uniref:hypothetical protein n=1 Tax=Kribbella sp. C-35 TaxID=2789276 RepID=UPI00397CFBDF